MVKEMSEPIVLLKTDEVAKMLSCSKRQVAEYRKAGIIPGVRFGKKWQYFKDDIDQLIEKNRGRDVNDYRRMNPESAAILFGLQKDQPF